MPSTSDPRRKVRRLTKFLCDEVSVARVGANEFARILIRKSGSAAAPVLPVRVDEAERYIGGLAFVSEVGGVQHIDTQGDTMSEDDLREAAHAFMRDFRAGKVEHKGEADKIAYCESLVLTREVQKALGIDLKFTAWWIGGHVQDDTLWQQIRDGEFAAFSVGGTGVRVLLQDEAPVAKARWGGAMTFSEALARTTPPSRQAVAQLVAKARTPATTPPRKAAAAAPQATPPKAKAPAAPARSVAIEAAYRRIAAEAAPRHRQGTDTAEAERVGTLNDGLLKIAAKVSAPMAARAAIKRMTSR